MRTPWARSSAFASRDSKIGTIAPSRYVTVAARAASVEKKPEAENRLSYATDAPISSAW